MTIKQYLKYKKQQFQENKALIIIGSTFGTTLTGLAFATITPYALLILIYPITIVIYELIQMEKEEYEIWKDRNQKNEN